jgi:hypothetical protein
MKSLSRQQLGELISAYRSVLCNAVTSSTIQNVFSVESVQSANKGNEFRVQEDFSWVPRFRGD